MAVPEFQSFFLPFLQYISDGKEDKLDLTPEDRKQLLSSGTTNYLKNRVAWTRTYLKNAGLLTQPSRGVFQITERGRHILASNPTTLRIKHLMQFPELVQFHKGKGKEKEDASDENPRTAIESRTPEEIIGEAYQRILRGSGKGDS